jgi:DNA-binding HxlR family transcriptional regulator
MRSYRQYCALAKALDVVGDRWTLLIVRELLIRNGCRYTDLLHGLPGIATNLLADRLRSLEQEGIVRREDAPPPVASTLYHLTPRGEELRPVVHALGRWGGPRLAEAPAGDAFQSHWLAIPAELHLHDRRPEESPVAIEVRTGEEPLLIETVDGVARIWPGRAEHPDAVLAGTPELIVAILTGRLDLPSARARGAHFEGDPKTISRVLPPRADPPTAAEARTFPFEAS